MIIYSSSLSCGHTTVGCEVEGTDPVGSCHADSKSLEIRPKSLPHAFGRHGLSFWTLLSKSHRNNLSETFFHEKIFREKYHENF